MRNLNSIIPKAPNFKYYEFIKSQTAFRLGINNIPEYNWIWENIEILSKEILQPIRDNFGPIRISSGYRSIPLCIAIGSDQNSAHTVGEAADIEPFFFLNIPLMDIINYIYDNLSFREMIAEYFPLGWVHISYSKNRNDRILKLKDKENDYEEIDIKSLNKLYLKTCDNG